MATKIPTPVATSNSPTPRWVWAEINRAATPRWSVLALQETVTKKDAPTIWQRINAFVTLPESGAYSDDRDRFAAVWRCAVKL